LFDIAHSHAVLWQDGKMRDIGTFSPDLLNDRGDVVGTILVNGHAHAVFWRNGKLTDLGTLGRRTTYAYALNDHGQVVGESVTTTGAYHAFVWENGTMTDLGTLPGDRYSHAWAITNSGQIVGTSVKSGYNGSSYDAMRGYNTPSHAVLWTQH
jgi:probable HAF family extracellular repeat protein